MGSERSSIGITEVGCLQMDEEDIKKSPNIIGSFHDYNVIQAKVSDLNKKRKSENDQLCVPQLKYKFGCKNSTSDDHEQPLAEESDGNKTGKGKTVAELDENENTLELEHSKQRFTYAQSCTPSDGCSNIREHSSNINKGELLFRERTQFSADQLEEFVEYTEEIEDMMACSNEPSETDHMPPSGKLCINEEKQQEPGEPTIDQEFEQYFSALLL